MHVNIYFASVIPSYNRGCNPTMFSKCIRLKMVSKSKNQARFMLSCSPFVERKGEVVKNTSRIIVFNPFIAGQIERNEGVRGRRWFFPAVVYYFIFIEGLFSACF